MVEGDDPGGDAPEDGGGDGALHPGDSRHPAESAASAGMRDAVERPRWPMIILRTPKGWTCPKELDGHKLEGSWRAHQMPILDPVTNPAHLKMVEDWLRSYRPEELFDENGALIAELKAMAPVGTARITANPHANGGPLRKPLDSAGLSRLCG